MSYCNHWQSFLSINSNIGCIETFCVRTSVDNNRWINSNIGCIETNIRSRSIIYQDERLIVIQVILKQFFYSFNNSVSRLLII